MKKDGITYSVTPLNLRVEVGPDPAADPENPAFKVINVKYGDQISPLAWTTYRADDICDLFSQDGDLHRWKETKSLCIQDLGTEPTELLYMGNRRRVLRSILEARGDVYDRLTLISSNFPPNALADTYGFRVQSRIVQMCNPIYLGGNDRRK